ncbi:MAG TPA: UGSC family (seleno)protein, partial [Burkholderiales bacterium]|nr:UGSC family (seleno)protein [Burkholderiales bacterium]
MAAEEAGIPSSTLVCEGFLGLAASSSIGLGMPNIPVARVPGHTGVQSKGELRENILNVTLERIIDNLTQQPAAAMTSDEPGARDVIFTGDFDAVNRYFYEHELSDGLPIVPPTREKIEAFLRYTDRKPDDVIGILLPDSRAATVWSVAVNGVMAGCRPEYMPVLVALVEAMADPYYGVEHSGNTPGGETLILLNGPIIKELGFNYEQGVMRDGYMPNTSVGRFWRLYLRNVAGFLPGKNDKAT